MAFVWACDSLPGFKTTNRLTQPIGNNQRGGIQKSPALVHAWASQSVEGFILENDLSLSLPPVFGKKPERRAGKVR